MFFFFLGSEKLDSFWLTNFEKEKLWMKIQTIICLVKHKENEREKARTMFYVLKRACYCIKQNFQYHIQRD